MRQLAELRERVTRLEGRVDDWRTTLDNHTGTLNAIRKEHLDQGKILAEHGKKIDRLEAEMRDGFGKLAKGQELITNLLTRHLGEPDESQARVTPMSDLDQSAVGVA